MKIKNIIIAPFIFLFPVVSAIAQHADNAVNVKQNIGGGKDKHGCYISAGYIWSALKKQCIRTFELTGSDTNAIALRSGDNTKNMVVLFSKNKTKAEIFYDKGNIVVTKSRKANAYWLPGKKGVIEKLVKVKDKWQFVQMAGKIRTVLYQ